MMPTFSTRLAYGFGSVAFGAKLQLLNLLLLFYNQLLGLPATWVSAVLAISLGIEAVWDPIVGHLSDHTRSRIGRRHPYLYAVALPLAVVFALLWRPPAGLSQGELLAWLAFFVVASRLLIGLHEIPSSALLPELTRDYDGRTSLVSYRYFFLTFGAALATVLSYGYFLKSSPEHPFGQLNLAGYAPLGATVGVIMLCGILISALGTHRQIPKMSKAPDHPDGLRATLKAITWTLSNRNFLVIAGSALIYGINRGVNDGLAVYVGTFFWGLPSEKLLGLALVQLPASFIAALVAPMLSRRVGKKQSCISVFLIAVLLGNAVYASALLGLLPPPGSTGLYVILLVARFIEFMLGVAGFIIVSSMIADIVEENEVRTGRRSEGLLFSADTFLQKMIGGVASILPGIILAAVAFPPHANPATLDPSVMRDLILILLPLTFALGMTATLVLMLYRIDRRAHELNLAHLAGRGSSGSVGTAASATDAPALQGVDAGE